MKQKGDAVTLAFPTVEARDAWIINNADYFTVGRRLGPGLGYERHEVPTLVDAENLGRRMADTVNRAYLIYAVSDIYSTFVKAIHPEPTNA